MISQYQNEIFALAAIFILLLIYLLLKRKNKTTFPSSYDTEVKKMEQAQVKETDEIKTKSNEQSSADTPKIKNTVPDHGKISKENFKIFSGERILLAEDNLINQKVILGVLEGSGIEVVIANDGQEALDILQTDKNFLIILMDAHMPRVDGFEATKAIKHNPDNNHITIIALSGDTASDDIRKMKEAGMDEHLEKPLKIDALYDILYRYSNKVSLQKNDASNKQTLDIKKGLQVCGNDTDFYHDILKEFLSTYSNSAQELEILLKNNKRVQADHLLLDIIGVSANIGADALNACANEMKNGINANKSIHLALYKKRVQELVQKINNYFLTSS